MVHIRIKVYEYRLTSSNSFDGDVERDGYYILEPEEQRKVSTSPLQRDSRLRT